MRNILITGASGFIGRHLLRALAPDNQVWALVCNGSVEPARNVVQVRHDLTSTELPANLPQKIDAVIHLAQGRHFRDFPEHARETFAVNVEATMALLEWARLAGATTFVLASSGGLYGGGSLRFAENDQIAGTGPLGFYLTSKHCAELVAENYASCYNLIVLRFFFVYGLGQNRSMLIPRLVDNISSGRPITLNGDSGITINPTYVTDAVRALIAALSLGQSEKINVAGPEICTLRSIADLIGQLVGRPPLFTLTDPSPSSHLVGDTTKMSQLLCRPLTPVREGLQMLCHETSTDK